MPSEPIDPESHHVREVYAHFGLTVYMCQVFERGLAIALASVYGPGPTKMTKSQYDDLLSSLFGKTLGHLLHRLKKATSMTEDFATELEAALTARNFLIHQYFWERAVAFMSEDGRNSMIDELQKMRTQFESVDSQISALVDQWAQQQGLTRETMDDYINRLLREND